MLHALKNMKWYLEVGTYNKGQYFGEESLVWDDNQTKYRHRHRIVSGKTIEKTSVMTLNSVDFKQVVDKCKKRAAIRLVPYVQSLPCFNNKLMYRDAKRLTKNAVEV